MEKINTILGSLGGRKFLMAIAGVLAIVLHEKFGISETQTLYVAGLAASFIFAQGFADGQSKGETSSVAALKQVEGRVIEDKSST